MTIHPLKAPLTIAGVLRSGKWPAVRKKHLAAHPACEVCGTKEGIEVHHVLPYQDHPELELDPGNLLTLCEKHGCHLAWGHFFNFSSYNPNVRADSARMKARVANRPKGTPEP